MPDSKITALASIGTGTDPVNDALVIVDVSDVSPGGMSATGTTKRVSLNNLLASSPTATLASATITGDLTVRTNKLAVTSTGVGLGTASPATILDIQSAGGVFARIQNTASSADAYLLVKNTVGEGFFGINATGPYIYTAGSLPITFTTATSERYRIASDGVATWSNVGGVAGTAMTLNSTGLGVGTSPSYKLDVSSSSNIVGRFASSNTGNTGVNIVNNSGTTWSLYNFGSADANPGSFGIYHQSGTNFLQISPTGNVGIGVTPSAWGNYKVLEVGATSSLYNDGGVATDLSNNMYINSSFAYIRKIAAAATRYEQNAGAHAWYNAASSTAGSAITFTQAMTLDASSSLMVNTATVLDAAHLTVACTAASGAKTPLSLKVGVDSAGYVAVSLRNQTAVQGTIVVDVTGARYLTASDYRLKNVLGPISGGLARVNALKPSIYKWKADGSTGEGFIAHELAEVVPAAVNGAKDAVNEDGTINPQNVDMSRIVPILVAAIKELTAEVNALKNA